MDSELKRVIEQFIIDYENQIDDIDNMDIVTTSSFLEVAIDFLTQCVTDKQQERLS